MLTHSELNMLSQLTALSLPVTEGNLPLAVSDMVAYHVSHPRALSGAAAMTLAEWQHSLSLILANEKLMALKILGTVNQPANGLFGLCFTSDTPLKGIITFRGTVGLGGWMDNYKGAFTADTPQQKNALTFLKAMQTHYGFSQFDLAGHSKGGNNAQYITVLYGECIGQCVTFNSPGFSADFLHKYKEDIKKNREKITAYECSYDIVNILLSSIAGRRIIIEAGTKGPKNNHKPNHILDYSGAIGRLGIRNPFYITIQNMTIGLSFAITNAKKRIRTKPHKRE